MPRLHEKALLIGCFLALTGWVSPNVAEAQVIYPALPQQQAAPNQPKLSPYLNLLRNDDSILNPYHAFVLPRRELNQQQAWQGMEIKRLERAALKRTSAASNSTSRLPTGNGGRFQAYLHFYGSNQRP